MARNVGYPQTATSSGPTPPRTNVGGTSIGVSTSSTASQVVTEIPISHQPPQRHGLAPSITEMTALYGSETPSDTVPS